MGQAAHMSPDCKTREKQPPLRAHERGASRTGRFIKGDTFSIRQKDEPCTEFPNAQSEGTLIHVPVVERFSLCIAPCATGKRNRLFTCLNFILVSHRAVSYINRCPSSSVPEADRSSDVSGIPVAGIPTTPPKYRFFGVFRQLLWSQYTKKVSKRHQ